MSRPPIGLRDAWLRWSEIVRATRGAIRIRHPESTDGPECQPLSSSSVVWHLKPSLHFGAKEEPSSSALARRDRTAAGPLHHRRKRNAKKVRNLASMHNVGRHERRARRGIRPHGLTI